MSGLYFIPADIDVLSNSEAWKARRPDINGDFIGVYPWTWRDGDDGEKEGWEIISNHGVDGKRITDRKSVDLLVPPILQQLILNRHMKEVIEFADNIAALPGLNRIVPAHFRGGIIDRDSPGGYR